MHMGKGRRIPWPAAPPSYTDTPGGVHFPVISSLLVRPWLHIKLRIKRIEIPAVQFFLGNSQAFAKTLVMDYFTFHQELNWLTYIIILHNPQDVVISASGFLLCGQILVKVGYYISFGLEFTGIKGYACCCLRPDTCAVVNLIRPESLLYQLVGGQVLS